MTQVEKQPQERHTKFFRAVVALAREHNMSRLTLKFGDAIGLKGLEGGYLDFTGTWTEGRHGDKARMRLEWAAGVSLPEEEPVEEQRSDD